MNKTNCDELIQLSFVLQINADSIIIYPMHRSIKLIAENTDQPIYFYMSSYQGRYSFAMWNETTPYGIIFSSYIFIYQFKLFDLNYSNCFIQRFRI